MERLIKMEINSPVKINVYYNINDNPIGFTPISYVDYEVCVNNVLVFGCRVNNNYENNQVSIPHRVIDVVKSLTQTFEILNIDTNIELKMR